MTDAAERQPSDDPSATNPTSRDTTEADAPEDSHPRSDGLPRRRTRVTKRKTEAEPASIDLARRIVELAEDKKAADIVILDLTALTTFADYFVICSAGSERQLGSVASGIVSGMRDAGTRPFGREGTAASHWILVDFATVIVHVFTPPEREFYQLERHWSEAKTILRVQ